MVHEARGSSHDVVALRTDVLEPLVLTLTVSLEVVRTLAHIFALCAVITLTIVDRLFVPVCGQRGFKHFVTLEKNTNKNT